MRGLAATKTGHKRELNNNRRLSEAVSDSAYTHS